MMDITIVCSDTELAYKKEQHIDIQLGIPRNYCSNVAEKVIQVFREVFIEGVTLIDTSRYGWNKMKAWIQNKMMEMCTQTVSKDDYFQSSTYLSFKVPASRVAMEDMIYLLSECQPCTLMLRMSLFLLRMWLAPLCKRRFSVRFL